MHAYFACLVLLLLLPIIFNSNCIVLFFLFIWFHVFVAGIGSLNIGLIFFCSIFASVLSDRYGIRRVCFVGGILSTIGMYASSVSTNLIYLYITYGLVLGIGTSLVYAPSLAILGHYFTKRLGLVNGLVTAGSSGFSIVMPIVLRMLINNHGIQNTFKYLTILMASLILCSLTFKETIHRSSKNAQCSADSKRRSVSGSSLSSLFMYDQLWKNRLYLCWLISIPTGLFGYFVPFCHLVKHAQDINSDYPGEVLVMCISIFSLLGRLVSGPLADFSHVNRIAMQQIAFISIGLLTMSLTLVEGISLLLVCCGLGLFDGTFISLLGPIAFDLVGPENANQAIGLLLCFCSLPLTTGPPIAGNFWLLLLCFTLKLFFNSNFVFLRSQLTLMAYTATINWHSFWPAFLRLLLQCWCLTSFDYNVSDHVHWVLSIQWMAFPEMASYVRVKMEKNFISCQTTTILISTIQTVMANCDQTKTLLQV